jgi:hypothetical protein
MLGTSADHVFFPSMSDRFFKLLGEPCDETPTYKGLNEKTLDKKWLIEQIKMGHDIVPQFQYNWPEVNEGAE